jgi:cathepsin L
MCSTLAKPMNTMRVVHRMIYERNVEEILRHNADPTQTWKKGVNQFTDLSREEMKAYFGYNAAMARARRASMESAPFSTVPAGEIPTSMDWRDKGIVSPVKNQGGCGSCWAFAATEAMETSVAQTTGHLPVALSTQNVVSCALNPHHCGGTGGCGGATAEIAFDYVAQKGISSEAAYPYRAQTGTCKEIAKVAKIDKFVKLAENNYTELINTLATVGPLAVNVDANPWGSYSSGVFTGCQFRDIDVNHVVQVVGYGTDTTRGKDYWIVRNSWGTGWGEKGYIRLERHSDGDMKKWCGPDTRPQDGTGCDGGPSQITVCGSCGIWYDSSYAVGGKLV